MALCPGCGNEVPEVEHCPVCRAGRGAKRGGATAGSGCPCPRCDELLETQDWEGIQTLSCPSCRGTFFPGRALETVLNKLRATCDPVDVESVLKDFKDRFTRELPKAVRYKACPVCETVMTRRNYATVSGVIVDCCPDHGIWVDEAQFGALTEFICRGGDALAQEASRVRQRMVAPKGDAGGGSLLERFFGK